MCSCPFNTPSTLPRPGLLPYRVFPKGFQGVKLDSQAPCCTEKISPSHLSFPHLALLPLRSLVVFISTQNPKSLQSLQVPSTWLSLPNPPPPSSILQWGKPPLNPQILFKGAASTPTSLWMPVAVIIILNQIKQVWFSFPKLTFTAGWVISAGFAGVISFSFLTHGSLQN